MAECFFSERSRRYLRLALLLRQNLAFVDPGLHADHAVGGTRLAESVLDVGTQRVQRQTPLQVPLRARDFVSIQSSGNANLNPLASEAQCRIDALAHGAAESHAFLKLQRD